MHSLLARQLKRLGLDEWHPPSETVWGELLTKIDQHYVEADHGHALLERSLALSSMKMQDLYAQCKRTNDSELAHERNTLQTVLHSLGEGLCVVDADWKIRMLNQQAERLFKGTAQALMDCPVYRMISPGPEEYREECLMTDATFPPLASGEPYRTDDGLLITTDGQLLPISLVVTPMSLDGTVAGAVLVFRDITHQKHVERERQQTEDLLRRIQTGLSELAKSPEIYNGNLEEAFQTITRVAAVFLCVERVSIWFFTEDHSAIQCAKLYHRTTQEHSQGLALAAAAYPRYFQQLPVERIVAADDAQRDPRTAEFRDGYFAPLGISSTLDVPIRSENRMVGVIWYEHTGPLRHWTLEEQHFAVSVANLVALAIEAADRRKTEQALRTSEGRLTMIAQSTNIGIWDWDLNSNEVYLSPEWKRQLGYEDHEVSNTFGEWENRLHPEDHDRSLGAIEAYLSGRTPTLEMEHRLRHQDGSYRWILARGKLIKSEGGWSTRLVGIHIDVTDRKRAEEALRQAKDAAEAASLAKGQFLANMSHEIRTPMHGVLGMAELLLQSPLNEKERHLTQSIHRSGSVLLSIINDILDFSKIEAGKLQLEAIPFEVRRTIQEAVTISVPAAEQKRLKLSCRIDSQVPSTLLGDPTRLRQILMNLVGNAVKFTERGTIVVDVELKEKTPERCGLSVSVTDTGIGISPEVSTHIFEAFSQADGSTTRKYGGTGLGLAIVKQLVGLMGGTIDVQSRPGEGARFQFSAYFKPWDSPAWIVSDCSALSQAHVATMRAQYPMDMAGARILLVEDNPVNREVACGMLETFNCAIDTAENGREALDATAKTDYALVLMDCQMPEMDGLTVTKLIRAREAERAGTGGSTGNAPNRRLPIVALTAHATQGDRELCLSSGMDDYLTKPFTLVQLEKTLFRWLPNSPREQLGQQGLASRSSMQEAVGSPPAAVHRVPDRDRADVAPGIDHAALAGIRALQRPGQPDILARVLRSYLETSQESVDRIRSAVRAGNATELRAAAHRLKSSSAQLGASAVAADCRELELMGERQDLAQAEAAVGRLDRHYPAACAAFQEELANGGTMA